MAKKIKVKRSGSKPEPVPVQVLEIDSVQIGTWMVTVGDLLRVLHPSTGGRWLELELKRISVGPSGNPNFHFFNSPPGSITVTQDSIKKIPTKKKRKTNVIED